MNPFSESNTMIDALRIGTPVSSLLLNVRLQRTQGPGGEGGFPTGRQRAGRRGGFRLSHEVDHRGASASQGDVPAFFLIYKSCTTCFVKCCICKYVDYIATLCKLSLLKVKCSLKLRNSSVK